MNDRGGIVCGSSECPICGRANEALLGPCADCDEYFQEHGTYYGRRRR